MHVRYFLTGPLLAGFGTLQNCGTYFVVTGLGVVKVQLLPWLGLMRGGGNSVCSPSTSKGGALVLKPSFWLENLGRNWPLKSPRGSPTKNGLPAYSAFSIVLAVSERSLSRLSNPSPNNCFPESGKSSFSKDESCGLSLASWQQGRNTAYQEDSLLHTIEHGSHKAIFQSDAVVILLRIGFMHGTKWAESIEDLIFHFSQRFISYFCIAYHCW